MAFRVEIDLEDTRMSCANQDPYHYLTYRPVYSPYDHPSLHHRHGLDQGVWILLREVVDVVVLQRSGEAIKVWCRVDCMDWEFRDQIMELGARIE
jgi:hypothetical protein